MFVKSFGIVWGLSVYDEGVLLITMGLALSPQTVSELSGKQACSSVYMYLSMVMLLKLMKVLM